MPAMFVRGALAGLTSCRSRSSPASCCKRVSGLSLAPGTCGVIRLDINKGPGVCPTFCFTISMSCRPIPCFCLSGRMKRLWSHQASVFACNLSVKQHPLIPCMTSPHLRASHAFVHESRELLHVLRRQVGLKPRPARGKCTHDVFVVLLPCFGEATHEVVQTQLALIWAVRAERLLLAGR